MSGASAGCFCPDLPGGSTLRNVPRRKRKGLKEEMKDEEGRTGERWSEPKTGHAQHQGSAAARVKDLAAAGSRLLVHGHLFLEMPRPQTRSP